MARIGFIGLGNMGLPMAQNLIKAGHQVEGVDVSAAATDKLRAAGGAVAETAKIAASRADVVITMLPAGAARARGLSRPERHHRERQRRHAADRLLDHRRRNRARRCGCGGGEGPADARCAGVGRRRRRDRRHAHLHGGRTASRRSCARSRSCNRWARRSCMRAAQGRAGGEDLQQHDPRHLDDRGVGGLSCWPRSSASTSRSCSTLHRSRPGNAGR